MNYPTSILKMDQVMLKLQLKIYQVLLIMKKLKVCI